ncbi:hypothetical protein HN51_016299 [Arachis hypogaea]
MSLLPDELWRRILEIGIENRSFNYKTLCCITITCRRLGRLSAEDPLWNRLLSIDFPLNHNVSPSSLPSSSSAKSIYKFRFERDKERRVAAHRRAVLRKESQVAEHSRRLRAIETRINQETSKMRETVAELSNLRRVRQASVALNVWQPEVVRGRQKQMVEQSVVPAESRIHALEMELRLCRQQIIGLEMSYQEEKRRHATAKEELESINYHPVQEYNAVTATENGHIIKQKKLKRCNSCKVSLDVTKICGDSKLPGPLLPTKKVVL